jgi:hypothetical protein
MGTVIRDRLSFVGSRMGAERRMPIYVAHVPPYTPPEDRLNFLSAISDSGLSQIVTPSTYDLRILNPRSAFRSRLRTR